MDMDAAKLREILRTEYGINSENEFDEAVKRSSGVDIGIFTLPLSRRRRNDKETAAASA